MGALSHTIYLELPAWTEACEEACCTLSGWPVTECDVLVLPVPAHHTEGAPAAADDDNESDAADGGDGRPVSAPGGDPYALLGLAGKRWTATQEDIRSAYRKLILKCHPDKRHEYAKEAGEEPLGEEEATIRFRELQAAFETLSDPKKRREFDSSDDFDGTTPKVPLPAGADFFETYAPVFERYSRWSERRPVPQLGSSTSAWAEVAAFYNFWYDFRSWRVFCEQDEHDLSEAEFRDERRWMERQNEKARAALKREESGRIAKLVEDAYSQDPRVRTRLQQEKEEKERAKREAAERGRREAEERRRAEEAGAAAAEAARRAQAEEAAAKKRAKEKERDALRKARARVKALASSIGDGDGEASAQAQQALAVACAELPLSALSALSAQLEAAGGQRDQICRLIEAAAAPILKAAGIAVQPPSNGGGAENDGAAAAGGGGAAASGGSSLLLQGRREHRWTAEELALLQKGSVKFPAGIQERWARVAEFINDGTGGRAGLTEKAVTEQVKLLRKGATAPALARAADKAEASAAAASRAAPTPLPAATALNAAAGAAGAPRSAASADAAASAASTAKAASVGDDDFSSWELAPPAPTSAKASAPPPAAKPPAAAAAPKESGPLRTAGAAGATPPNLAELGAAAGEWSAAQQASLEAALKAVPKKAEDRWDQIAAAVAGKDSAQCHARFKYLAAIVSAKKQAAAS